MFHGRGMEVAATFTSASTARAIAELSASPVMAEAKRHAADTRRAERQRLAEEAARIKAECERHVAALKAEMEAAQLALAEARDAVAAAVARETDARSAALARSLAASSAVDKRLSLIVSYAEPAIAEARRRLLDLHGERPDILMSESVVRSVTTGARTVKRTSRARSLAARHEVILAGIAELDAMSREVDQTDVAPRIDRIFARIPEVEFHTETIDMPIPPQRKPARDLGDGSVLAFTGA